MRGNRSCEQLVLALAEPCRACLAIATFHSLLMNVGAASPEDKNTRLQRLLQVCPAVDVIYELALRGLERQGTYLN